MSCRAVKLVFLLYLSSCVLLESGTKTAEIPSVWQEDHGTITYQDNATKEQGKLTKFWAQEAIGVPESKELIAELKSQGIEIKGQDIGVIDLGGTFDLEGVRGTTATPKAFYEMCIVSITSKALCKNNHHNDHATKVINLIADKSPVGVSSTGVISNVDFLGSQTVYTRKKLPPIINQSGKIFDEVFSEKYQKYFDSFVDRTILVQSSGNEFPELPSQQVSQYKKKTIVVGSIDPTGFPSRYSQPIEDMGVYAPSDTFIQSRGASGLIESFGGTSGAAPQVTGALADVRSILPSLTRDEAVLLLRKTSTPIITSAKNGTGTLNQYRALRVATRLKDKGFPANRETLLYDYSIYNFKDEAQKLVDNTITDPKLRLKNLRKAFFLDPDNISIRKTLADFYSSYGFAIQSRFYDNPKEVIKLKSQKIKVFDRAFLGVLQKVKKIFRDSGVSTETETAQKLVKYFNEMSDDSKVALVKRLSNDPEKSMLQTAIEAAGYLADQGTAEPLQLLVERAKTTHPDLLTEKHIVQIVEKHSGILGKVMTGVKKLDMKKMVRAANMIL